MDPNRPVEAALLAIFFQEAGEIVRELARTIRSWSADANNPLWCQRLLESLHTLRGGAMLCGLEEVADQVRQFERYLRAGGYPGDGELRGLRIRWERLVRLMMLLEERAGVGLAAGQWPGWDSFGRWLPRWNRVVQQAGRFVSKPVALKIRETELELDADVVRRLGTPLEEILRNAVYHGIETLEQRRGRRKPVTGRIELRLSGSEDVAIIEVEDDGGGIDTHRLREIAIARGHLGPDVVLVDGDAVRLVFVHGLSTMRRANRTYGSGVGLSAVHTWIAQLGGRIEVASEPGEGTRFSLSVPGAVGVVRTGVVSA